MKPYGKKQPFFRKKSGYWPVFGKDYDVKNKGKSEEKSRAKRWYKRLARRFGKHQIKEQQQEQEPKATHP